MHLDTRQSRVLAHLFALLAEDLGQREIRELVGHAVLELFRADHFASFVWDEPAARFVDRVAIHMDEGTLATYDAYYQYRDPITFKLQARRAPTLVNEVMAQRDLVRTEFYNDFLARDGLYWGMNVYCYDGTRSLGDLRIWRGRRREAFDTDSRALLAMIEPAFAAALRRARAARDAVPEAAAGRRDGPPPGAVAAALDALSPRERAVARAVGAGLTDKEIAARLGLEPSTVRTYLKRIFDKLGVGRRSALAARVGGRG